MKIFQVVLALAIIALASAATGQEVEEKPKVVNPKCYPNKSGCNAYFSGFKHHTKELQRFTNHQLTVSFDYLLLATNFGTHLQNRPGFEKTFLGLSNKAWDNTINLIKKNTQRGGLHNFNVAPTTNSTPQAFELEELDALKYVLDAEKQLALDAHELHMHYTHKVMQHRDPEMAHYLQEKFLEDQAETIRKLSGYTNDLKNLYTDESKMLNLHLFDEYLSKQ